jgi:hypothetical protein
MLRDLSDDQLLKRWAALQPTDDGTSPEQDEVADEMERRGLGV